jgi:hypothetical protein
MGPGGSYRWCGTSQPSPPMFKSFASKSPGLTPFGGGILPSGRCGGGWGPTGLMANNLWDVSRRGTAKHHVNWGENWVPLELPINLNEVHHSDHVVMLDKALLAWGETKCACNQASRPLGVKKDIREKGVGSIRPC